MLLSMDHHEIALPQGTIRNRETGQGRPDVFVHGIFVAGELWDPVVDGLPRDLRCIVPDWPFGAHETPLNPDADRTVPGMAKLIADVLEALDLRDVVLVGNDTGGALCQLVATRHAERLGALVLTSCDVYDHFFPKLFRPLQWAARAGVLMPAVQPLRVGMLRRTPLAFGWLSHKPLPPEAEQKWVKRFFGSKGAQRDVIGLLKDVNTDYTHQAARDLAGFDKPALVAWSADDKVFPVREGRRLADAMPNARFELIEGARTFVTVDQPERLAKLIGDFVRDSAPAREPDSSRTV